LVIASMIVGEIGDISGYREKRSAIYV